MRKANLLNFCGLAAIAVLGLATSVRGATGASDSAIDPAYSGGFNTGTNGGSGFGAWTINAVTGGSFINGGSNDPANLPGPVFDIWNDNGNTGVLNTNVTTAIRPFTGALNAGQTVSFGDVLHFGNQNVGGGSWLGWSILDSSGATLMDFHTGGGLNGYFLTDSVSNLLNYPAVSYNYNSADTFAFTLNDAAGDYTLVATGPSVSGNSQTITGKISMGSGGPAEVAIYDNNGGSGSDVQFNNLAITAAPEPAGIMLAVIAAVPMLRRRRRI